MELKPVIFTHEFNFSSLVIFFFFFPNEKELVFPILVLNIPHKNQGLIKII